jgi:type I restriction enzyme S subunit
MDATPTPHKKQLAPKLRFKEFSEDWRIEALTKLYSNIVVGFVGTISNDYCDKEIGVQFIRTLNVKDGWFSNEGLQFVTKGFHQRNKKSQVKNGDILIARVGANMGLVCEITGLVGEANSANVIIIKDQQNLSSRFYTSYLSSIRGQKQIQRKGAGGAQEVLNISVAKTIHVPFIPLPEQQKIASFLSAVEQKIQQLTHKKELLEQYKKGVMQQLLSGKLRFKYENGNVYPKWEKKTLGDIGNTFNGLTGKTKENFGKGKPYIQYMQIFANSRIEISKCGLVQIDKNEEQQLVQYGDVFFTMSSETPDEIGTCSVLLDEVGEMYLNSFCFGFRLNSFEQLVPSFAAYLFRNEIFRRLIIRLAQGSTRYNMSKVQLMKLKVSLPTKAEQQKITSFLTALDAKIESVTAQIAHTQTFKKGLLQQMFV